MRQRRALLLGLILLLVGTGAAGARQFSPEITLAINQVITGVTPFTAFRTAASSYLNWGSTQGASGYGFRDSAGTIQVKNSGGGWADIVTGATLPTAASFITRVAEAQLSNETAMGALGTGLVINTTTTGVPTIYAGASCTNQFPRSVSASGAWTCQTVSLVNDVTGTLAVTRGGTGLATGTIGGVPYFSGATTIASSGALTVNQLVLGGGASGPSALGSVGTTATVLHGNAAGAPSFAAVDLTTTVTGVLPVANGGTGVAYFGVAGPTVARVYTFPDADATVLTSASAVTAAQGGTGHATYAVGDLLQASGATTLARLAAVATGNVLISGGVTTVSSWGKVGLTTHVSGTLPVANGGTSFASYTVGDIISASGATTLTRIAAVATGSYLRAAGAATLPVWSTTTLPNAATAGDLMYASAANTYANLADVAVGSVLVSGGVGVAPAWSATPSVTSWAAVSTTTTGAAAGNVLQTLATTTAGDDPTEVVRQYNVNTTDGAATTIATIAVPQDFATQYECKVTGHRTGGAAGAVNDSGGYVLQALYTNTAGAAAEIAAETLTVIGESQAGWTVAVAPSGGNAVVQVTGAANNNVTWHMTCRSVAVGT